MVDQVAGGEARGGEYQKADRKQGSNSRYRMTQERPESSAANGEGSQAVVANSTG
jgi:hypothetical protein